MKRINTSLKKTGILFSLVLLSPGVMAEILNINYEREGILSLEPRLGLQARACHSKADPMNIRFRFGEAFLPKGKNIVLTIEGADYRKSYSVFSASEVARNVSKDSGFLVPWGVSVSGKVNGAGNISESTPGTAAKYEHAFCFADGYAGNSRSDSANTYGYYPLFEDYVPHEILESSSSESIDRNKSEFRRLCRDRPATKDEEHVWSTSVPGANRPIPDNIEEAMRASGDAVGFLTSGLFYLDYTSPVNETTRTVNVNLAQPPANDSLAVNAAGVVSYTFPISIPNADGTYLTSGDFALRLNNRNISKITLAVSGSAIWSWERGEDYSNNLHLVKKGVPLRPGVAGFNDVFREPDDALPEHFYKKDYLAGGHFRGTLVKEAYLSQDYMDYINNIMPLSLPATEDGVINLVNTDSLTFSLGKKRNSVASLDDFYIRVSGQPLKFASLRVNGKEVASAMQMRNVCY